MKPILILTKNILNETQLQQQIQQFNWEVFSSTSILQMIQEQSMFQEPIVYFSTVIISETVGETELYAMLPLLNNLGTPVVRLVGSLPSAEEIKHWNELGIQNWLLRSNSLERIREILIQTQKVKNHKSSKKAFLQPAYEESYNSPKIRFSSNERKILRLLQDKPGEKFTRSEICKEVWGEETESTKSQLSSLVSRINKKAKRITWLEEIISTYWGQGYSISEECCKRLQNIKSM